MKNIVFMYLCFSNISFLYAMKPGVRYGNFVCTYEDSEDRTRLQYAQQGLINEYTRKALFYGLGTSAALIALAKYGCTFLKEYFSLNPTVEKLGTYGIALASGYLVGKHQKQKSSRIGQINTQSILTEYQKQKARFITTINYKNDIHNDTELMHHAREFILAKTGLR